MANKKEEAYESCIISLECMSGKAPIEYYHSTGFGRRTLHLANATEMKEKEAVKLANKIAKNFNVKATVLATQRIVVHQVTSAQLDDKLEKLNAKLAALQAELRAHKKLSAEIAALQAELRN